MIESLLMSGGEENNWAALATSTGVAILNPESLEVNYISSGVTAVIGVAKDGSFIAALSGNTLTIYDGNNHSVVTTYTHSVLSNNTAIPRVLTISNNNKYIAVSARESGVAGKSITFVLYFDNGGLNLILDIRGVTTGACGPADFSSDSQYLYTFNEADFGGGGVARWLLDGGNPPSIVNRSPQTNGSIGPIRVHPLTGDVWFGERGISSTNAVIHIRSADLATNRAALSVSGTVSGVFTEFRFSGGDSENPEILAYAIKSVNGIRETTSPYAGVLSQKGYEQLPSFGNLCSAKSRGFFLIRAGGAASWRLYRDDYPIYVNALGLSYSIPREKYTSLGLTIYDAQFVGGA